MSSGRFAHLMLSFRLLRSPHKGSSTPKSDTLHPYLEPFLHQRIFPVRLRGLRPFQWCWCFFFLISPSFFQLSPLFLFSVPLTDCILWKHQGFRAACAVVNPGLLCSCWQCNAPTREKFGEESLGSASVKIHARDPAWKEGKGVTAP